MVTNKQKEAIQFTCTVLQIEFIGNINNKNDVSLFLSEYLDEAKNLYEELQADYNSYLWDLVN